MTLNKNIRAIIIALIVLVQSAPAIAQKELKYSLSDLKILYSKAKSPNKVLEITARLSGFYLENKINTALNTDSAFYYASLAVKIARSHPSLDTDFMSEKLLMQAYLRQNKIAEAKSMLNIYGARAALNLQLTLGTYYLFKSGEYKNDLDSSCYYLDKVIAGAEKNNDIHLKHKAELREADILHERSEGSKAVNAYNKLAEECLNGGDLYDAAEAYSRFGDYYNFIDGKLKIKYYTLSMNLYARTGHAEEQYQMLKAIADVHLNTGKLDSSERELLTVADWLKSHQYKNLQDTYYLLSVNYRYQGNLDKALNYALETVRYADLTESDEASSYYYNAIAQVYNDMGNEKASSVWLKKTFDLLNLNISELMYGNIRDLSDHLIKTGQSDEVLQMLNAVRQTKKRTPVENEIIANIKGNCYFAQKKYKEAESYYLEMMKWEAQAKVHTNNSADSYHTIAEFYLSQRNFDKAQYYLNQVLLLPPHTIPIAKIKDVYLSLYKLDSAKNDLATAIVNYKKYKSLSDSIINQTKNKEIQELQIKYETDQKEKENNLLKKEGLIQNDQLQKANLIKTIAISGIIALLLILLLLYKYYRNKQKASEIIIAHQNEIALKNESLEDLIGKQEKLLTEKEWLIREIHHRVKNNLQVIMSLLNTQANFLDNKDAVAALQESQHRLQSIALIHQKLFQSDSVTFIEIRSYIIDLMKYLCDTLHFNHSIEIVFDIVEYQFDIVQAMPLGLIINEAMTNIIKYAFPHNVGRVNIVLKELNDKLFEFSIEDNGIGLPVGFNKDKTNTLGMILMQGLSMQLGGQLFIDSNDGVRVAIIFPKDIEETVN